MTSPLVISSTGAPSELHGLHGGRGVDKWKRFVTGLMLHADWDSFEHNRVEVGGLIGEHVHTRTEEIYYIVSGRGWMKLDDQTREVGPGDLIMTPSTVDTPLKTSVMGNWNSLSSRHFHPQSWIDSPATAPPKSPNSTQENLWLSPPHRKICQPLP